MAKYIFLITINPVDGKDDELNSWLDDRHIPEVLQTAGFKSCKRYQRADEEASNPRAVHKYMHMYEVETDDLAKTREALMAPNADRTPMTPALDLTTMSAVFFKAR